ncbi:glycosyltransferase [Kitasatospora sp. NPDC002227]|uniref:glycosyltransferase n=1 Tax=Kitasatospora sp. NPDC002227 TaxID=3154773 RepID=UPI0033251AFE
MVDQQTADATRPPAVLAAPARGHLPTSRTEWAVRVLLPLALLLWALALSGTRLSRMGDLGLMQALPPTYWAAVAVLTVGFVTALRGPLTSRRWPAAYVCALIVVIHATPSLLYPTVRYAWSWKHLAIIDAMLRHGGTVPNAGHLDIYNQWPGFFELNGAVLQATGLSSVAGLAAWYPLLANLLLIVPLVLIFRALTGDRRLVWGALWLYFATSWIGQDYFAPQAFAYLLYLVVLALVLRRLPQPSEPPAGAPAGARALSRSGSGWRPGPFLAVVALIAAIVCSHQLTPLMLISTLTLLALRRRYRAVVLPVLATAVGLTFLWDATVARPYISQNLDSLVAALFAGDQNIRPPGQIKLGVVDPEQVVASYLAWATTGTVLLLAVYALLRHRWTRRTPLPWMVLAPLPLLLANNYGGEMVMRAYLFALPAAAFLAATALLHLGRAPRAKAAVSTGLTLALLGGLFCGYYSKEAMNYFTPQEVAAAQYVARTAPAGSRIVSVTADLPGGEDRYDEHQWLVLAQTPLAERHRLLADPAAELAASLDDRTLIGPSYLVLTRAQAAGCRLTGVFPADTVDRARAAAASSPDYRPVFANQDAVVYLYAPGVPAGTGASPVSPTSVPESLGSAPIGSDQP